MPRAGLQIVNLDTLAASDGLATGAVDAAMLTGAVHADGPGTNATALYEEEGALLVRRGHRAVRRGQISPEQLNALRHVDAWLVLGRPSRGHPAAEGFFARHG
jgi:DNA-binding transcriptional LysR family regulator